jgi:hypothetical protein
MKPHCDIANNEKDILSSALMICRHPAVTQTHKEWQRILPGLRLRLANLKAPFPWMVICWSSGKESFSIKSFESIHVPSRKVCRSREFSRTARPCFQHFAFFPESIIISSYTYLWLHKMHVSLMTEKPPPLYAPSPIRPVTQVENV